MTDNDLTRLLHEAVPPIPREVANPPLATIRRRVQRRRVAAAVVAAGGLAAVAVGVGGVMAAAPWQGAGPGGPVGPNSMSPTSTPASTATTTLPPLPVGVPPPGSMRAAVVDRAGTKLTVYVNPDPRRRDRPEGERCVTFDHVVPTVDEGPDRVVVTYSGEGELAECDRAIAAPRVVTLARPLDGRLLVDGDGTAIRPFFEADLPLLPGGWTTIPSDYGGLDGGSFIWGFQSSSPVASREVHISARVAVTPRDVVGQVTLGSRTGLLFDGPDYPGLRWTAGDLTYELRVIPNEGDTGSLDDVRSLIDEFDWP